MKIEILSRQIVETFFLIIFLKISLFYLENSRNVTKPANKNCVRIGAFGFKFYIDFGLPLSKL